MRRYLYKDSLNRTSEYLGYDADDFVSVAGPANADKPIKTNSSGILDSSFFQAVPAALLQITRTASEPIVPGDVVYATSASHVGVATFDVTRDKAQAIGVAVTSAEAEEQVTIVMMGIISSPAFAIFGVNEILFLDQEGAITNDRPIAGFLTKVGKSLGSGEILIQLTDPLVLG